jgi:hypothetical protein
MNVLLINNNPVVSRLLSLCTRDEYIIFEEVKVVSDTQRNAYDIVFVDIDSYSNEIATLDNVLQVRKKILLSKIDEELDDFDLIVKKPFLPSQIIEIIKNVDEEENVKDELDVPSIFPLKTEEEEESTNDEETSKVQVLDTDEIEKIKALLDMDEESEDSIEETVSEEEYEKRKIKVIKEQLISDGLEIIEENNIVDELSNNDEVPIFSITENFQKKTKSKKKKSKKKKIKLNKEDLENIEGATHIVFATLKPKKMKKLLKGKKVKIAIKLEKKDA